MKRTLFIIGILGAGIAAALWLSRRDSPSRFNFAIGNTLSSNALARVRVAGGGHHALAIAPDGSLWSWGNDLGSALGLGNVRGPVAKPTRVGAENDWTEISAGYISPRALKRDGSLWAWGSNPRGMLGDGTEQQRNTPVRIGTDNDWGKVGSGLGHTAGLKRDGSIWAWGDNSYGQLGIPSLMDTTNQTFLPMRVGMDSDWKSLVVCANHNVAIKSNGTLWTWGDSSLTPAVAPNSPSNHYAPVQMGDDTNWLALAAGYYHTLALKSDGTIWNWGRNSHLLGAIPAKDPSQPRQVGTNADWVAIYEGAYHNLARKRDGTLWHLGDRSVLGKMGKISGDWVAIGGGAEFNLAVAPDGSLWHWGTMIGVKTQPGMFQSLWRQLLTLVGRKPPSAPAPRKREVPEKIFELPAPSAPLSVEGQ